MPAGVYDFDIEQKATFDRTVTWLDIGGAPVNLTGGWTALMRIEDDAGNLIVAPALTLGGAAGTIHIVITAAITAGLAATRGRVLRYDLLLTAPGGGPVTRLLRGAVGVSEAVS